MKQVIFLMNWENKMSKFIEWTAVIVMGIILGVMFGWGF